MVDSVDNPSLKYLKQCTTNFSYGCYVTSTYHMILKGGLVPCIYQGNIPTYGLVVKELGGCRFFKFSC